MCRRAEGEGPVAAISAVCLDAYGTLVRIGERRHPYQSLFRLLGVDLPSAARLAMTTDLGIEVIDEAQWLERVAQA